jgi:hypothetical protein
MGTDNVSKANINTPVIPETVTPEVANATTLVNSLPTSALYAKEFQPLLASINPAQVYPFSPMPLPYSKSDAYTSFTTEPNLLATTLQSASSGLQGVLDSLDVTGSDQAISKLLQEAEEARKRGDMLTMQQKLQEAQKLQSAISTMLSIIGTMQMEAIRNAKLS